MDPLLRWAETSAFSVWTRESTSVFAYPAFLSAHAIGMGLVVGVAMAVALRALGVASGIPPGELRRFEPLVAIGVVLNTLSGLILMAAYPTKALTNPVFYVKLALIAVGFWSYLALQRRQAPPVHGPSHVAGPDGTERGGGPGPRRSPATGLEASGWLAIASLASWAGAITAGRLLAYTYRRLFVDF